MRTKGMLLLSAALVGLTTTGAAQQHRHGGPDTSAMGPNMMNAAPGMHLMMRAMWLRPQRVLAIADQLGLSQDQHDTLQKLVDGAASRPMMGGANEVGSELLEAFEAETPDTTRIRSLAGQAFQQRGEWHARMLVEAAIVRSLLTPEQREKLWDSGTMGKMHMHDCPMSGEHHGSN